MNVYTLTGLIAVLAIGVTIVSAILRRPDNWVMFYLRNFLGTYFVFSGVVKAIDPIGTSIKMGDYFAVFSTHFSFLTPLWDMLAKIALPFAMFMIILEIVLGVLLILGIFRKTTLWLYMAIIVFFLFLTGFTFMTGYVPGDATFLEFSKWVPFQENNMKVTDCGCFGDFVKLKPFESFCKDIMLLVILLLILPFRNTIKSVLGTSASLGIFGILTVLSIWFSFRNVNNLPIKDFRAYAVGTDLRKCTSDEGLDPGEKIVKFVVTKDGQEKTVGSNDFGAASSDGWKYKDRIDEVIREPELPKCKDFIVVNNDGEEFQDVVLGHKGVSFWVNSYDLDKADKEGFGTINSLLKAFNSQGVKKLGLTGTDITKANKYADGQFEFYNLDATPIKTMNRANPGLTIIKDGVVVGKYHHNHLPDAASLKKELGL